MHLLCNLEELTAKNELKVTLENKDEIIVILHNGQPHAFLNRCPHAMARLDMSSESFFSFDKYHLFCSVHGALFHPESGLCVAGPCTGQSLSALPIEISEGKVWLCESDEYP